MGKIGVLWELALETGQFRTAKDLGYQTVADIDPTSGQVTYREGTNPVLGEEIFWCPSTSGFKSWRAMSYHPPPKPSTSQSSSTARPASSGRSKSAKVGVARGRSVARTTSTPTVRISWASSWR